ncbi:cellulase family glycosylhydrolase [Flavobacterium sp. J27]|uniref:cellulase family glycosylhydrolase n=1 Tax=Flavobacterium sp. J27 TaxID=2060419 RepID=UPI001032346E|nr:cellulase family glycosylhydrolase [Flavobacterium sp. J27]
MKTLKNKKTIWLSILLLCTAINYAQRLTVSATGSKILKEGNPITLRGVNFGNWLLWEGYMMNLDQNGIKSHSQIRAGLKDLLGNNETKIQNFETNWRNNYITNADFARVKELGYNVIRIPYHYNMFWNSSSNTVKNDGFVWLDKAVNWASANNIYVILCMHAAPGYQNPDHHSDNPGTSVTFWGNNWANVEIAKKVWKHIANHYKNYAGNEWIAGYDLLNEPKLDIQSEKYKLKQAYKEMTAQIRSEDSNHLIFAEGNYYSSDFYDMQERWDNNLVFSNHYYGSQGESNPNPSLTTIKNLANNLNIPLWTGEFGENTATWVKSARIDYDTQNVGWAFWAWKRQNTDRSIYSFNSTSGWDTITNYLKYGGTKPSTSNTESWLNGLINNIKLANASYKNALHDLLIPSKPFNQTIWLRNSNQYVCSNNGVGPITANRTSVSLWEKFTVINAGDGKIALRGNNGKYVNSQNGTAAMTCSSNAIAGWEAFEWVEMNGQIALKGFNGKFVSSEGGSGSGMNCNRETVSGWEAFDWSTTSASRMELTDINVKEETYNSSEVVLFPNPANESISFQYSKKMSNPAITIFNGFGQEILYLQQPTPKTINISHFPSGTYLFRITDTVTMYEQTIPFIKK